VTLFFHTSFVANSSEVRRSPTHTLLLGHLAAYKYRHEAKLDYWQRDYYYQPT